MYQGQVVCSFKFLCNQVWDDLQAISGTETERLCTECSKPVYLVQSYHQLEEHVKKSHCVALKEDEGTYLIGAVWRTNKAKE